MKHEHGKLKHVHGKLKHEHGKLKHGHSSGKITYPIIFGIIREIKSKLRLS